ncbi:MAG: 5-oxoprolinase subunit PxpB [Lachnospiraceae bacterium]|nr:5-oxoprolinase subunit PxpB [Lachnospiraceae bacterium]
MEAKLLLTGDCSLSVQMGEEISLAVNQRVRMLFLNLTTCPIEGVREMVPTYASLMIHYQPEVLRFEVLKAEIVKRLDHLDSAEKESRMVKEIPICYGGELGPDLENCAAFEKVSVEEFIRMHSQHEYYSYMLGFAPGHAYMARFEEPFHFKRRESPRVRISGGSIVVQLNLSNLIPFDQPCGWNIVGATPLTICDYQKEDPFLVHAGDWVKYVPVSRKEFDAIKEEVKRGMYRLRTYERTVK